MELLKSFHVWIFGNDEGVTFTVLETIVLYLSFIVLSTAGLMIFIGTLSGMEPSVVEIWYFVALLFGWLVQVVRNEGLKRRIRELLKLSK